MITVIATHNKNKIREMQSVLVDILNTEKIYTPDELGFADDVEENGKTFEENALIKARSVWKEGYLSIADDSGLCVNALDGAPGVFSARYAGEPSDSQKNNEKLLCELKNKADRNAYFVCAIACKMPNGEEFTVRGTVNGTILEKQLGNGGFGYDPLFYFPTLGKTFAELTGEEKHEVSHRGNALRLLEAELKSRRNAL